VFKVDVSAIWLSFRLVRNRSDGFKEGFLTRFTHWNDSLFEIQAVYGFLNDLITSRG